MSSPMEPPVDTETLDGMWPFKHDCLEQHAQWPSDNTPPVLHGYDASVLKARAEAIRDESLNRPTVAQRYLQYEIVAEFLLADLGNNTMEQYYGLFESWTVLLDKCFFDGSLTQGPQRLVTLRLFSTRYESVLGLTAHSIVEPARQIVILLRNCYSGGLHAKLDLFETLLHELTHVYAYLFFNFCPALCDFEEEYMGNDGHGLIWSTIFHNACAVVASWHPAFYYLGRHPKAWIDEPAAVECEQERNHLRLLERFLCRDYLDVASRSNILLSEWEADDLRGRSKEFRISLLNLTYASSYKSFLRARVPFATNARNAFLALEATLLLFAYYIFWIYGYGNEFAFNAFELVY
ncbi:hypothetical protein GGS24DRAFT_498524 [Hypoxylon argillaceum]|nr:hypothetical protein GGS24DRAFT_498524 [Hypoxylon argillaceum]